MQEDGSQRSSIHSSSRRELLRPLDTDYDVIMAMGSMHHAPMDILKPEYQELLRHLKVGGRWLAAGLS